MRGPCTAMKSGPHLPQLEKVLTQKRRPNTAKNYFLKGSNNKKKRISNVPMEVRWKGLQVAQPS